MTAAKTDKPPFIDGKLDDEAWRKAALADGFWISEQQRWPTEKTEVLVLADQEHLYFGFRVYDSQPDKIEAKQTRRDFSLGLDDQVTVELDPFHNFREISSYSVNAIGTQKDEIAGGRARNIQWKGDWKAASTRTDYGWSAEIAIPFEILNYHDDATTFGINFVRYHNRTDEFSRWADVTVQNKPEEMGRLVGLEIMQAARTEDWTFMPYVLFGRNARDKEGEIKKFLGTGGIDIRYQPRQNLTGVLSFNPDFSQLESQVTDINFTYTEKFQFDPRPFFQEGGAYFGGGSQFFYSNRVPDFDYGGKFFAQLGQNRVGFLMTEAPGSRWDTALRLSREIDPRNTASAMVVTTDRQNLKNQLLLGQFSGRQPFGLNYSFDAAMTTTQGQRGDGGHVRGGLGWRGDFAYFGTSLDNYTVNFFPANGLLKGDLPDTRGVNNYVGYYRDFGTAAPLRLVYGNGGWIGRQTADSLTQNKTWYGGGGVELQQQIKLNLYYSNGFYRPVGSKNGQWSDDMNHDRYWTVGLDFNTRSSLFGYGSSYSWGELGGGTYGYLAPYLWVRPTNNTFLNFSTERLNSFGHFDQTIVSGGWDITKEDGIAFRYILANGDRYYRLAYSHQVQKGINIFAVLDKEPNQELSFSVKLVFALPFSSSNLSSPSRAAAALRDSVLDSIIPGRLRGRAAKPISAPQSGPINPPITVPPTPTPSKAPQLDKQPAETKAPEPQPNEPVVETRELEPPETTPLQVISVPQLLAKPAANLVAPENVNTIENSKPNHSWFVQVMASADKNQSLALVKQLEEKGYKCYSAETLLKGTTVHRVRVGPLANKKEAEAMQKTLSSKEGFHGTFIVPQ